jgi:hypothetical protein
MNPQRQLLVRLTILKILAECNGYLLPDIQLFAQLAIEVRPPVTVSEFESEIKFLDADHLIAGIRPELGGGVKWKITDAGKLARIEA